MSEEQGALLKAFQHADPRRRESAIEQAVAMGDEMVPTLVEWMSHHRRHVRESAAIALERIHSPMVVEELNRRIAEFTDPFGPGSSHLLSQWFVTKAIEILEDIPDSRVPEILMGLAQNPKMAIATRAMRAFVLHMKRQANSESTSTLDKREAANAVLDLLRQRQTQAQQSAVGETQSALTLCVVFLFISLLAVWVGGEYLPTEEKAFVSLLLLSAFSFFIFSLFALSLFERRIPTSLGYHSIQALAALGASHAIGLLAKCATDKHLARAARAALASVLDTLTEEDQIELTPDERRILWSLLKVRNYRLQASLLRAMPLIGDATALEMLEPYINKPRVPQRLRAQAQQILPPLRERVERLSERRVLLRAADESGESTILLRAAERQPEIPENQLLRKPSEE